MAKTKIEWCDETVNFITGCRGKCSFCYARGTAASNVRRGVARYIEVEKCTGDPFHPAYHHHIMLRELDRLDRATKPRIVFLGSMSEPANPGPWLYLDGTGRGGAHQEAADTWVQEMLVAFAAKLPRHRFVLLTKRPDNLLQGPWPSNVCLGVSVTSNDDASRIRELQERVYISRGGPLLGVSVEPLMDPDFDEDFFLRGLDWVIVGAQTGTGSKKLDRIVGWEREDGKAQDKTLGQFIAGAAARIADRCAREKMPCFIKDNLIRHDPDRDWPRQYPADWR